MAKVAHLPAEMNFLKTALALTLIIVMTSGWGCCPKGPSTIIPIDDQLWALTPYTDGQEVLFLINQTDTVRTQAKLQSSFQPQLCAECCEPVEYESRDALLLPAGAEPALVWVSATADLPGLFYIVASTSPKVNSYFPVSVSNGAPACDSTMTCLDSLVVSQVVYHNVLKLKSSESYSTPFTTELYYSPAAGVLKFILSDGTVYEKL